MSFTVVNRHVSWHFPSIDSHRCFNLLECFGLTYRGSTGRHNATETCIKRPPIDHPAPKNSQGPAMTERRGKSLCLLINGDPEFYVLDQYITLFSHDLMISCMCPSLTLLSTTGTNVRWQIGVIRLVFLLFLKNGFFSLSAEPKY